MPSAEAQERRRVLVIGAHPDDIEFGAGGTIARWVDDGFQVRYVIVTSGQRGVQDATPDLEAFGRLREEEAKAAAKVCGVADVAFLGYMDSEVLYSRQLQRDLAREFRRQRPHRLLTMSPEQVLSDTFINHPDHRTVAQATLDMVLTGGTTAAIFPELELEDGLPPWRELEDIWLFGAGVGTEAVDVTAYLERKIAALEAHASQLAQIPGDIRELVARRLRAVGAQHGFAYAESFRVIKRRR
ncbi:MAG TPA: PIG-L deacetylase family protein [Actinomycetes bacterium]|nr:PIG-L deacetylase family protein [Actinomycetes bacterium]